MSRSGIRWGAVALMLGAGMFALTKVRHVVDPTDAALPLLMAAGMLLFAVGVATYYAVYGARAGRLGRSGIALALLSIPIIAVGHIGFLTPQQGEENDLFLFVIIGVLLLLTGTLTFGVACLRNNILGHWRALPLLTALAGIIWLAIDDGRLGLRFHVPRTLFALGWILLGLVLWREPGAEGAIVDSRSAAREQLPTP